MPVEVWTPLLVFRLLFRRLGGELEFGMLLLLGPLIIGIDNEVFFCCRIGCGGLFKFSSKLGLLLAVLLLLLLLFSTIGC